MPASYDPIKDPSIDKSRIGARHALFYHDANQELPDWFAKERVKMVVGNTPWGNKIGNEGDGAQIILNLARQFDVGVGEGLTMNLLVGKPCFADLAVKREDGVWGLNRHATYTALESWELLHHAEVGTTKKGCVLMILVKKSFMSGQGKTYDRLHYSSY